MGGLVQKSSVFDVAASMVGPLFQGAKMSKERVGGGGGRFVPNPILTNIK